DVALFTNLSHEHLELHGTFEAYRDAKRSLFERLAVSAANPSKPDPDWPRCGIVNANDVAADVFVAATREAGARVVTYSLNRSRRPADVVSTNNVVMPFELGGGVRMAYATPRAKGEIRSRLIGAFNLANLLAVIALGEALDLDPEAIRAGLESVDRIPGRMERVIAGQPFEVIVDYAHTPASLQGVLNEMRRQAKARRGGLIVVFGSAGERDTQKRPDMGQIAGKRCRLVVLTDEDPRGEDRNGILAEIAVGAIAAGKQRGVDLLEIPDRRAAIRAAFERARPGDVVLLAGKGHESTILYADHAMPWDEAAEALAALAELGYSGLGPG
ncbi:MAG TPA: UDP-N-acetylmuramyl-tripeptide synthetase, partial [Candidatus Limnocylindrales bacterium]